MKTELFGSSYSPHHVACYYFKLSMSLEGDEGHLKSAPFSFSPTHEGLLLLVTARDAQGDLISSDLLRSLRNVLKVERNPIGILTEAGWDKMSSGKPAYSLEVEDGSGGWLPMLGPVIVREADGRPF